MGTLSLIVTYRGYDTGKDLLIEKAARRRYEGGGYCFQSRTRDLEFRFASKQAATNALRAIRKIKGVTCALVKD